AEVLAHRSDMQTAALVAPVTALEFLQEEFLLTGEGPVLTVYRLQPHPEAGASLSVLQHHRVHGIRPRGQSCATGAEPSSYDLAVFGGKAVRLVRLHVDLQDEDHLHLEVQGPLMELGDWVLDVRWLSGGKQPLLCVAVAHNSALLLDISTGAALVQRSCQEGCLLYSALLLVHESWADAVVVGGTVFNQLVLWNDSDCQAPVERRLLGHSGVIFSISYLQEKGWLASASDDRSVRVWGVGALGGPGGRCGDRNPACLRVLYGHQARVFSVRLSPGKVFSAGEDGACLVWDWAGGGKVVRTLKGHRAGGVRALAVSEATGDEERWVATGGADGGVRLWRVKESEGRKEETEEAVTEKITDLNFPGLSAPKVMCGAAAEDGDSSWSQRRFVVCTDQGEVYQYSTGQWEMVWRGTSEFQSYCVMETVSIRATDSAVRVSLCAVGNLSGSVQVFPVSRPQCGILLSAGSGKIHSLIWQEGGGGVCLLASGAEGLVYRWCVEVTSHDSLTLSVNPLPPFLLPPSAKRWLLAAVRLHSRPQEALWVCGDRRGSLLLFKEVGQKKKGDDSLLTGRERSEEEEDGSDGDGRRKMAEQRESKDVLRPLSCLFGVHGKQGVTSLSEHRGLLYSSGRDGCVRKRERLQLQVLRVQRACRGMEWLERVLILEEEEEEEEEGREEGDNQAREARIVIAGFHSVHFVVWDPVRQERLLAVPCGGGHRSWILWPSSRGVWPGYGALVFIKHRAVLASQPPGEEPSRAGRAGRTGGWGLREGIHGRGVGCVCRLGRIEGAGSERREERRGGGQWEVVVTGGEDTSLTIVAVHPASGCVRVLSVINDHISSVRTVASVTEGHSVNQSQSLSALLVSAGGRAQLQCYRLLIGWDRQRLAPSCQVIQVAAHRLDEQWERKRNRHKTVKMDPETRYMSVVVLGQRTDSVLLALGCSDGAVRLFSVSEVRRHIDLLWETFHHQRCVLSVATCSLEDGTGNRYQLLFSAATDGKIAVWDLSDTSSSTDTSPPIPCLDIPAHQSGINSLAVWAEKLGQQGGGCLVTVASGGDDGQLTVSTVKVHYPEEGGDRLQLRLQGHAHIPLAHAAPLTALRLLTPGLLVSTSSDQRVCLWRVCSTAVCHRETLCSHVADAAGLAVPTETETGCKERTGWVLVCGQGLQLLRVRDTESEEETGTRRESQNQNI
uniref:tRNA (34-2'-O)-methyltransferase regulator WDR6 n=1 Tax=Seriola dumerili TaxID=41447 RepID=A0A3B4UVC7_SERDU